MFRVPVISNIVDRFRRGDAPSVDLSFEPTRPLNVDRSLIPTPSKLDIVVSAAVDTRDHQRAEYHRANYRAEIGTSLGPGKPGTSIIEHASDGRVREGRRFPRLEGYYEVLERLRSWVVQFGRKPDEIELIQSRRQHVGMLKSDGQQLWIRFHESSNEECVPAYQNVQSAEPATTNARVAKEFTERGFASKRGLVNSKGVIISIHENIFALDGTPDCIPRLNYEYLVNRNDDERRMQGCRRGKGTFTNAIGEHTLPGIKTLNFLEFKVWYTEPDLSNRQYATRRERSVKPMSLPETVDNARAEESLRKNSPAAVGYRMRDGLVWRMPQYKGPKSGGQNLGTQAQSTRFLEIINEVFETYGVTEVVNLSFSRIWGAHDKDAAESGHNEGKSFLFTTLLRCKQDPSAPEVPEAPPPRDPITVQEVMADASRRASAKLEHGVVNDFGEGWAVIEHFTGDFGRGELTLEEQNDEFLRRIADWQRRYPDREIQETFFSMAEARFLSGRDHGYRRRFVIRFKERNFDESMATTEYPRVERITVRDHNTAEMMEENERAFHGVEWAKNEGAAIIHYFVPPPFDGEVGVKEGIYQALLWLRHWSRLYPDRKIAEAANIFRWDSLASTTDSSNSFESGMFVRFEPR